MSKETTDYDNTCACGEATHVLTGDMYLSYHPSEVSAWRELRKKKSKGVKNLKVREKSSNESDSIFGVLEEFTEHNKAVSDHNRSLGLSIVNGMTQDVLGSEFLASVEKIYGWLQEYVGLGNPDFEEALERVKREGVPPLTEKTPVAEGVLFPGGVVRVKKDS